MTLFQMEDGQVEIDGNVEQTMETSYKLADPASTPVLAECVDNPIFNPAQASSAKKRKVKAAIQDTQEKDTPPSVSNCYVFKSRLQEYCQKAGVRTPVYETIKEGPSHEPSFRSTVVVDNVRYDSLPGFFNRKAAEQSAAEVALMQLANSVNMEFGISQPVHETGLCKNLLQEYAQKMNYAIPLYECHKDEKQGIKMPMYSCVVEIGGIKYIGASASTKKEAEIKAARTAMLAIQSAGAVSEAHTGYSMHTVVPQKKKAPHTGISTKGKAEAVKPKKARLKKQQQKKKKSRDVKRDHSKALSCAEADSMSSQHNMEVNIDAVSSQVNKTNNGGSEIYMDEHKGGLSINNIVSSQATDFGFVETTADVCGARFLPWEYMGPMI